MKRFSRIFYILEVVICVIVTAALILTVNNFEQIGIAGGIAIVAAMLVLGCIASSLNIALYIVQKEH